MAGPKVSMIKRFHCMYLGVKYLIPQLHSSYQQVVWAMESLTMRCPVQNLPRVLFSETLDLDLEKWVGIIWP